MKKEISFVLVLLLSVVCAVYIFSPQEQIETKYPSGRDTRASFGDGTYQVQRLPDGNLVLYNCERRNNTLSVVTDFQRVGNKVYVVGADYNSIMDSGEEEACLIPAYAVIEIPSNQITLCLAVENGSLCHQPFLDLVDEMISNGEMIWLENLSDFPEEDYNILKKMS